MHPQQTGRETNRNILVSWSASAYSEPYEAKEPAEEHPCHRRYVCQSTSSSCNPTSLAPRFRESLGQGHGHHTYWPTDHCEGTHLHVGTPEAAHQAEEAGWTPMEEQLEGQRTPVEPTVEPAAGTELAVVAAVKAAAEAVAAAAVADAASVPAAAAETEPAAGELDQPVAAAAAEEIGDAVVEQRPDQTN